MKIRHFLKASLFTVLLAAPALRAAETPSALDPKALEPLKRMSATLAGAKKFTCRSHSILEIPAVTGQFLTLFSTGEIAVQRPDKLRARLGGRRAARCDGFFLRLPLCGPVPSGPFNEGPSDAEAH